MPIRNSISRSVNAVIYPRPLKITGDWAPGGTITFSQSQMYWASMTLPLRASNLDVVSADMWDWTFSKALFVVGKRSSPYASSN